MAVSDQQGVLGSALSRADGHGRFSPKDLPRLREMVKAFISSGESIDLTPEDLLGPWEGLPDPVQSHLRLWASGEIRGTLDFHPRDGLWAGIVRGLLSLNLKMAERKTTGPSAFLERAAGHLWQRPMMVRAALVQRARIRRWKDGGGATVVDLLTRLGKNADWIMAGYTRGVPVDPRCRGYFHIPRRNVAWAYLLGIDLVPTPQGVVCHEANLDAGITGTVRQAYWEEDPIPKGVVDMARKHGFKNVIWVAGGRQPTLPWFYSQLWARMKEEGIKLEVLEDVRLPTRIDVPEGLPIPGRALFPPENPPNHTLVVRPRNQRVGTDVTIAEKNHFSRAIGGDLTRAGDQRVKVLPLTTDPGAVSLPSDPGVPNLVYKYPKGGKGEGVFFLRARDRGHALDCIKEIDDQAGLGGGYFQPWVCSNILPGRRIYEYRTMILVSPVGVSCIAIRRRETVTPLPETLEEGVIKDRRPFIITGFFENISTPVEPTEESLLEAASHGVGEAIARVMEKGFVTKG